MAGRHGGANHERWLITYADMLTLLLAFFIILYSISKADIARFHEFQQGMQQAFHVGVLQGANGNKSVSGGAIVGLNDALGPASAVAPSVESPNVAVMEPIPTPMAIPSVIAATSPDAQLSRRLQHQLQALVRPGTLGGVQVQQRPDGILISIYGVLLFDTGEAQLGQTGRTMLSQIATDIKPLSYNVRVEGNTDSIQPDGGLFPTNWELSAARALVVTHYLIDVGHVEPSRLSVIAYAEFHPVASNTTRDGRLRNRRVDLILVHPDPTPTR